jgi:hypothetical protein
MGSTSTFYANLTSVLDRATRSPRERYAENIFWTGRGRALDGLASRLFFELSAMLWAERALDADHLAPFIAALGHCPEPQRALDLGTGAGATAQTLAIRFPHAQTFGVDSAAAMLRIAASRFPAPNLRYVRGDLVHLPFPAAHFDLVTALNALPEPHELARVCAAGATAAIANTYFRATDGVVIRLCEQGFAFLAREEIGAGGFVLLRRCADRG